MDAAAKHTQVLTARQIQKTLQGRLAARLSTLQAALFSGDPTLPAPAVASYWIAPMWKQPPGAVSTSYRIVIGTTGETPQLALEVAQAYASAVSQLLAGYLKLDGEAAGASSTSLGESIPIRVATPVGTAVGTPPWFGDASTEALILSEVVIEVTQHEVMR